MQLGFSPGFPLGDGTMSRRRFLSGLAGVVGSCLLPGCGTSQPVKSEEKARASSTYRVSMEPVGTVEFTSVPETWLAFNGSYADMGVDPGQAEGLRAIGVKSRYLSDWYDELPGVDLDPESLVELQRGGIDVEVFFQLDCDVHLVDPNWFIHNSSFGLHRRDVERIVKHVGPFVGNSIFRRTDPWHDYRYYTLYEAFEIISRVFRQHDRYRRFSSYHKQVQKTVNRRIASLPKPECLLVYQTSANAERFYPYSLRDRGTSNRVWHDLGVSDALRSTDIDPLSTSNRGTIDLETILRIDPDALLVRGHERKTRAEFTQTVIGRLQSHPVGNQIPAIKTGRVYRGGPLYMGPIIHLFELEQAASTLYPDRFTAGQLIDRKHLSGIIRD